MIISKDKLFDKLQYLFMIKLSQNLLQSNQDSVVLAKNKYIGQCNKVENPEINYHIYDSTILTSMLRQFSGGKSRCSSWDNWISKLVPYFTPSIKNYHKPK